VETVVQILILGFIVLFAGLTIEVISTTGFDILSGVALIFLALIAIPVIGGLLRPPPDD
jgi:hypothetical protein